MFFGSEIDLRSHRQAKPSSSLRICRRDIVAGKAAFILVFVAIDIGLPEFLFEGGLTAFSRTAWKVATEPSDFRKGNGGKLRCSATKILLILASAFR
jgi:hypothetical protein